MTSKMRYFVAGVFLTGSIVVGMSCGGDSDVAVTQPPPSPPAGQPAGAPSVINVNVTEIFEVSRPIIVQQKVVIHQSIIQKFATVIVVNNINENHWIIADNGSFDTGIIPPGGSAEIIVEEVGDIPFHCGVHPNEKGIIRVQPAAPDATPTPEPSLSPPSPTASPAVTETPTQTPTPAPTPTATGIVGQEVILTAALTGAQEVPPVVSTGTGTATVRIGQAQEIPFTLNVSGLQNITAAHIHFGPEGTNGPVIFTLSNGPFPGALSGTLREAELSQEAGVSFDDARNAVLSGNAYVNVHTTTYPNGEIRGQLTR
ncbi:MAG TPA: hypothetical protein DIS93_03825 [Bdellovibrionales bacterium]|nr:hypothetical protein [Bdellovibrionales bacterium]